MFALRDYSLGASGVFRSLVDVCAACVCTCRALESAQSTAQVREANVEDMKVITYSEVSQAFAYT